MSATDPIADLFTRILNSTKRGHATVMIPASRFKANVLGVFQAEGFIGGYEEITVDTHPAFQVKLRYLGGREKKSLITGIRRVSKPGRRVYVGKTEIPRVMGGLGVALLSTSKGVVTAREARKSGIGGEVLGFVW
ncbi:MAG: 30S ribosomal protein S8 [Nitrospirales bacterium]